MPTVISPSLPAAQQLLTSINKHQPKKVYLAYSGGVDSQLMAHCLVALQIPFTAIHVNHQISSKSNQWQSFVEEQALQLGFDCIVKKVVVKKDGKGLEAKARELRYQAFAEHVEPSDVILLAQHQNDQAETLLLRLLRGAGVKGLSSMAEFSTQQINQQTIQLLRPWLRIKKEQIKGWAQGIGWVEDDSNTDEQFDRNFLRQTIIPSLESRWPKAIDNLSQSAQHLQNAWQLQQEFMAPLINLNPNHNQLDVSQAVFLDGNTALAVIHFWLSELASNLGLQVNKLLINQIYKQLILQGFKSSAQVSWGDFRIVRHNHCLYCLTAKKIEPVNLTEISQNQWLDLGAGGKIKVSPANDCDAMFWVQSLDNLRVCYRTAMGNPKLLVKGRDKSRDLKRLLQESNIPVWRRKHIPLILLGDEIILVADLLVVDTQKVAKKGWQIQWQPCDYIEP